MTTTPLHGDDHNDDHLDESLMTIMVISFFREIQNMKDKSTRH